MVCAVCNVAVAYIADSTRYESAREMPFEIITIPFNQEEKIFSAETLNKFCLNKKILSKRVEFFSSNGKSSGQYS